MPHLENTGRANALPVFHLEVFMSFENWMEIVDHCCQMDFGLSIHDLPDMLFRDAYDSGLAPEDFMAENLPDGDALRDLIFS